jgi:hypothetical protein
MVAERTFSPIAVVVHAVAIIAGLLVGWQVMAKITPDIPTEEPGVESSSAPRAVVGNDPDSLFLPNNLAAAIPPLRDQLADGQGVVALHIEPGSIELQTSDIDGTFDLADVPVAAPARIAAAIHETPPGYGLAQIAYMELVATRTGPRWYVQIDINATDEPPPWTYGAPLEGEPVTAGGGPPRPIEE